MRNNLRQLPDLTIYRTLAGILEGWNLTMERNEELHLWQSIRGLFLSVSATIFCENFVTNVDMHGWFAWWRKWRACAVGEAHSPTLPSLYLRDNSLSNSSVASPTSQFILQPFFRFTYVTGSSLTSPGEPPIPIYVSYKIFAKYCGRHWQKQGSDWLSQVQFFISFYCQIPPS